MAVRGVAAGFARLAAAPGDPTLPRPAVLRRAPLPLHGGHGLIYRLPGGSTLRAALLSPARLATLGVAVVGPARPALTLTLGGRALLGTGGHSPPLDRAVAPPALAVAVTGDEANTTVLTHIKTHKSLKRNAF